MFDEIAEMLWRRKAEEAITRGSKGILGPDAFVRKWKPDRYWVSGKKVTSQVFFAKRDRELQRLGFAV